MVGIICTIGPASFHKVRQLRRAGMSIGRLNFAYATPEQMKLLKGVRIMADVRKAADLTRIPRKYSYAALSYVGKPEDVITCRRYTNAPVVAKVETRQGLKNVSRIAKASDMVMVARGDLAKRVGLEKVGAAQLKIIAACRKNKVPVIVATGLLESMVEKPEPTRAEVSDVTHAVADGADYLMLANETAVGKYPVEATRWLKRIVQASREARSLS